MDPFWAAILGGAVGGVLVAVTESLLSRSREHEKWLREQRQRIYLDFVELAEGLSRSHERALDAASRLDTGDLKREILGASAVKAELDKVVRLFDVIASPSMRDRAYRLRGLNHAFSQAADDFVDGNATLQGLEAMQGPWISWVEMSDFTQAARRELGGGHDRGRRLESWYRNTWLNRWWMIRRLRAHQAKLSQEAKATSTDKA